MDVWPWICDLPSSSEWTNSKSSQLVYQLASSGSSKNDNVPPRSIQLRAERSSESSIERWITFSICVQGFQPNGGCKTIWLSDPCLLLSDNPFLPFVQQLMQETVNRAPITYHNHTHHRSQTLKIKSDPIAWILQTHSPESFSGLFNLLLITRLFWLCACDSPSDVGSFFFHSLLAPNLEPLSRDSHAPVVKAFLLAVGVDVELCLARAIGYMLAKWLIVKELRVGLPSLLPLPSNIGLSYASEACGLWLMKLYAPVWAMQCTHSRDTTDKFYPFVQPKESALRYALAHQQLEAQIQLEYTIGFHETYIQVSTRVDNIRVHVVKLGFNKDAENDDMELCEEMYFPSRIEFWVGPEVGCNYVASLSLGRSTQNIEREIETQKLMKGSFRKMKNPKVKTMSRSSTKTKVRNWRWDQDVEGNTAIFDAVFYENSNGIEVYSTKLVGGASASNKPVDDLGRRYSKVNRPFMKSGGLVFTGKEYGEEVKWGLSKEMEGSVLKWRIGGKVWLTYWPSEVESSFYETRCIEWSDEVDLPLIPSK